MSKKLSPVLSTIFTAVQRLARLAILPALLLLALPACLSLPDKGSADHTVSVNEVTLQLSQVLNTPDKAILEVNLSDNDPFTSYYNFTLYDEQGRFYPLKSEDVSSEVNGHFSLVTYPLMPGQQYFIHTSADGYNAHITGEQPVAPLQPFEVNFNPQSKPGEPIKVINGEAGISGQVLRLLDIRYEVHGGNDFLIGKLKVPSDASVLDLVVGASLDAGIALSLWNNISQAGLLGFEFMLPAGWREQHPGMKTALISIARMQYKSDLVLAFTAPPQQDVEVPDRNYLSEPYEAPEDPKIDPALQGAYDRLASYTKQLRSQPGWIHQVGISTDYYGGYSRTEDWIEMDDAGKVIRQMNTAYNAANLATYQSLTVDRYEFHPLDGSVYVYGTPEEAGLSLLDLLSGWNYEVYPFYAYDETGRSIEISAQGVLTHGSSECGVLLASCDLITYSNPRDPQEYHKYWLDPQTGLIYKQRSSYFYNTGAEDEGYEINEYELVTFETGVTPPADLLALFDKIYIPEQ